MDKFEAKLSTWKAGYLFMGGRLTLLKSVFGSLLIFFMSLFHISVGIREKLDKI